MKTCLDFDLRANLPAGSVPAKTESHKLDYGIYSFT